MKNNLSCYNFQRISFSVILKFVPKYFILDAIINIIVLIISKNN